MPAWDDESLEEVARNYYWACVGTEHTDSAAAGFGCSVAVGRGSLFASA